jgi:hypothetical protein
LDQHLRGISPLLCLRSYHGGGSRPLIVGGRVWLASRLSPTSVDLVGARLLLAKRPLEEFCRLRWLGLSDCLVDSQSLCVVNDQPVGNPKTKV